MTSYYQKNYASAFTDFGQYVTLKPTDAKGFYFAGDAAFALKNYAAALDDFSYSLQLKPGESKVVLKRAQVYYATEKWTETVADLTSAVATDPNNALAFRLRGQSLMRLKKAADAEADFRKVLIIIPNDTVSLEQMVSLTASKDKAESAHYANLLSAMGVESRSSTIISANASFSEGNYGKAIEGYEAILRKNPNDLVALKNRCKAHIASNNYQLALADATKLEQIAFADQEGLMLKVKVLYGMKEYTAALTALERITDRQSRDFRYYTAVNNYQLKNLSPALTNFEACIQANPNDGISYLYAGTILIEDTTRKSDAENYLRKAIALKEQSGKSALSPRLALSTY